MKIIIFLIIFLMANLGGQGFCQQVKIVDTQKERAEFEKQREAIIKQAKKTQEQEYNRIRQKEEAKIKIVNRFRSKDLSEAQARQALRPIIAQEVKESVLNGIDQRIEMLKKQSEDINRDLESLYNAKRNPDALINEKVNAYLGIEPKQPPTKSSR